MLFGPAFTIGDAVFVWIRTERPEKNTRIAMMTVSTVRNILMKPSLYSLFTLSFLLSL